MTRLTLALCMLAGLALNAALLALLWVYLGAWGVAIVLGAGALCVVALLALARGLGYRPKVLRCVMEALATVR